MKNIITLLTLLLTFSITAQSYSYEELKKVEKLKEIPKEFTEYTAGNGQVFKVGDMIVWDNPMNENNVYKHIYGLDAFGSSSAFGIRNKGFESEIIKFRKGGTKRMGFEIFAVCKTPTGLDRAYISIEKALNEGEIVSNIMTREQAIAKLKESKELLDLDLMTQEEYDKIRAELTPIITGKK